MEAVSRRHFIGGSAAFLLPVSALAWRAPAGVVEPHGLGNFAFFDQRFAKARRIAASWPPSNASIAVLGDITPWSDVLASAPRERVLHIRGVTTESFRFCAAILVGDHANLDLQFSRLDRDLVLWTMHTTPKEKFHG